MFKKFYFILLVILITNNAIKAQDRMLARTYQTNVIGLNNKDLEVWNTYSFGRENFYTKLAQRFEFEFGLSNKLQTSVYLNREQVSYEVISFEQTGYIATTSNISFSSEWKYKISDPVADKFGFALYAELTAGTSEIELEGKLIFDKKIDKHLFAVNITGESEKAFSIKNNQTKLETEENKLEFNFGYIYSTGKNFGLGVEIKNDNIFEEGKWMNSPLFIGPTISYSRDSWWLIFNALPQVINFKKEEGVTNNLELNDHEKFDFRLLIALNF